MALTYADLMYPLGPVTAELFPEKALNVIQADVTAFLTEAYAKDLVIGLTDDAKKDKSARAWALYRTFDSAAIRMTAEPLQVNNGAESGSHGYSMDQIQAMEERAQKYLDEFNGLAVVVGAARPPIFARNSFTW